MKLFCSTKLQKALQAKCEKVPLPGNQLDRWYANLVELNDADTIVAILPDYRFCVILWNVLPDPSTDLTQLLVPAIREALQNPVYGIPLSLIDRYMPEDTQLELCVTGDRSFASRMGASTMQLLNRACIDEYFNGFDPFAIQCAVNKGYLDLGKNRSVARWQAVKEQLRQQYGKTAAAMELEISMDLQEYVLRRTLVVSEDITFGVLHLYLQTACFYQGTLAQQIRPRLTGESDDTLHSFMPLAGPKKHLNEASLPFDDDVRLSACLEEEDRFRYLYAADRDARQWELDLRVSRRFPTEEDLPICTVCEGQAPPKWVEGADSYQEFCKVLEDPEDPRFDAYAQRVGLGWLLPKQAQDITKILHSVGVFP